MYNICLNEEKQKLIKFFIGEELYNDLYMYQKLVLQMYITRKDVEKFKKIKQYAKEEIKKNEEKRNNKNRKDNSTE